MPGIKGVVGRSEECKKEKGTVSESKGNSKCWLKKVFSKTWRRGGGGAGERQQGQRRACEREGITR